MFITFFLVSGNDVISLESRTLIFVYLYKCSKSIQKQIVKYHIKINILKNTRLLIKQEVKTFQPEKSASCRCNPKPQDFMVTKVSGTVLLPWSQNNRTKKQFPSAIFSLTDPFTEIIFPHKILIKLVGQFFSYNSYTQLRCLACISSILNHTLLVYGFQLTEPRKKYI